MQSRTILCVGTRDADRAPGAELRAAGWQVEVAGDLREAAALLAQPGASHLVGLLFVIGADALRCLELDEFLREHDRLVWVGAFDARSLALPESSDLILEHLFDHHSLPLDPQRLLLSLGHAHGRGLLHLGHAARAAHQAPGPIVGRSPLRLEHLAHVERIAQVDAPVLISGESGSGKDLAARAIHQASARAGGPFVAVNCGAMQPALIQCELFGYVRGAFSGALRDKAGLIESAHGGTVFLDEIGDLPPDLQINLLRFLQEKTIRRMGATHPLQVDVRVIAATRVNLEEAIAAGRFREDLYYRLNVLPLAVPALRDCRGDVEALAQHVFRLHADERRARVKGFTRRALTAMQNHDWPGNVRELVNRVRRAMVMAQGRLITAGDLGLHDEAGEAAGPPPALGDVRKQAEREAVVGSLQSAGRNVSQAARQLGVSRMTMYRLMAKHGIAPERGGSAGTMSC